MLSLKLTYKPIKCLRASFNLNDPGKDACHLKRCVFVFLVRHSWYDPSFCSDSTNADSNRFFIKLSLVVKFIWYCMSVLSFVLIYIYFFFP